MADIYDKRIDELPEATAIDDADLFVIEQNGVAKNVSGAVVTQYAAKTVAMRRVLTDYYYPIGSIYFSVSSASPSTLFGGTWQRIENRFLLAAGTNYPAGSTGGEATHTLTVSELPSHAHGMSLASSDAGSSDYARMGYTSETVRGKTGYTGGGEAHNNMPPYLAVYVWKRTA